MLLGVDARLHRHVGGKRERSGVAGDEARWVQRGRACNGRALAMSVSNRWTRRVVAKMSALEESNEVGRNERRLASATRRPDRAPFCKRPQATRSLCPNPCRGKQVRLHNDAASTAQPTTSRPPPSSAAAASPSPRSPPPDP